MHLRAALVPVALASIAISAFAAAPANSFNLVSTSGKNIGNASYTITKDKNGWHIVGKFQYHLGSSTQANTNTGDTHMGSSVMYNEGQFNEDFKVSDDGNFLSGYTQNSTNQMMTSFQSSKNSSEVVINQIQGGAGQAHNVTMPKPNFLIVPDFDPATLQIFLTTALAHPHDDKTYLFLVPAGSNPRGKEAPLYVILQLAPDTPSGTLDGKSVNLMHYIVAYHTGKADVYTDDTGTLMQADMGPLNVSYIRAKFSLAAAPAK